MDRKQLRVTGIDIKNVLGTVELVIEPGSVTIFKGRNASGKTSKINAIKAALGRGKLVTIKNIHSDGKPHVGLLLEHGDSRYHVDRRATTTHVSVESDEGELLKMARPQAWLEGLFDGRMSNPMHFLEKKDQRLDILLGSLDLDFDADALRDDVGHDAAGCIVVDEGTHPLQQIAACRRAILDKLQATKVEYSSKSEMASDMSANLPDVVPADFGDQVDELDKQIAVEESAIRDAETMAKNECERIRHRQNEQMTRETEENKRKFQRSAAEMRAEVEDKIHKMTEVFSEMRLGVESEIVKISEKSMSLDKETTNKGLDAIEQAQSSRDEKIEQLNDSKVEVVSKREQLAEMRTKNEASVKARALTEQVEKLTFEAHELAGTVDNLKEAIRVVDECKREMAKNLPIPGLEVDGKNILLDGLDFDKGVNKAKQIEIAVKISCIRSKDYKYPAMFVDNAESLDWENLGHLCDTIKAEGVQAFIGYRTDDDFEIEGR